MKSAMQMSELVTRIRAESDPKIKRDFVADTRAMRWTEDGKLTLPINGEQQMFPVNRIAAQQIASKVGIPQKYFDRMQDEAPVLLETNVNHWFVKQPERRMLRTLNGNARAFLGERFRPLDNIDVATQVLPQMLNAGMEVRSAEITDMRLYIQAVTARITGEVKKGDIVQAGVVISNSEVGCGSIRVEPLVYRLACLNGMITGHSLRRAHIGRNLTGDGNDSFELLSDNTKHLTDRAFWAQVNDIVGQTTSKESFDKLLLTMQDAAKTELKSPSDAVQIVESRYALNEGESAAVLDNLIRAGDPTKWGLINAITAVSKEADDYDRAIELERFGGDVLELPKNDIMFN